MNSESKPKRRFSLSKLGKVDKIILIMLAVLGVLLIVVSVMGQFNISLINGGLYIYGSVAMLALLLGWGAYALFRLVKKKSMRIVVGTLLTVVMFIVFVVAFSYINMFVTVMIPTEFSQVASPSGAHQLVILRGFDVDMEEGEQRQETRKAARLAADPEGSQEIEIADMGYSYYVYPKTLGFFYRSDAQVEGSVYVGYSSEAQLMVEWTEDESTAHFFIENHGVADGGDWYVHF